MVKDTGKDLRTKTEDELKSRLMQLRKEAFNIRFQQTNGQLANTAQKRKVRREIARVKTILAEKAANPAPAKKPSKKAKV